MKKLITLVLCVLLCFGATAAFADALTGAANGMGGEVPVTVEFAEGKIVSVTVGENKETVGIADKAIAEMPARIVDAQSLAVDTVAGATVTSNAILNAVEAALVAGGVDVAPFKVAAEKQELTAGETVETDVVVVGAGISGLMAAYELKEDYPEVNFIVLEKLDVVTGSVPVSGGAIAGVSSEFHKRDGVECVPEDFADLFTYTSGTGIRAEFVNKIYEKSGVLLERLIGYGTPFTGSTEPASKYSDKVFAIRTENRGSSFGAFFNEYVNVNSFDLRMATKAESLIVEDGKVVGVVAANATERYEIRAKAVLLATGGFGKNPELMAEYLPLFADGFSSANAGATGDAIVMTRQFGTKVVGDGSMGSVVAPDGSALINSNFLVNLDGERFIGEGEPKYVVQRACSQQRDKATFYLADANYADQETIAKKLEQGYVKQYDTIEALALDNGIDPVKLAATVEAYNAAADKGEAIPAAEYSLAAAKATKIETAPFYVEKVTLRTFGTIPGIEVADDLRVLTGEGTPVEGLYASGELIAGNAFTRQYPGVGIGVSFAANTGRLAAETIAETLK
ncbi:MAG: FAD-binding protein [Clostridia bacterium]|nr:FAD-binding protein [Clostridia bacterium]